MENDYFSNRLKEYENPSVVDRDYTEEHHLTHSGLPERALYFFVPI